MKKNRSSLQREELPKGEMSHSQASMDSDTLVGWNTAKELPKNDSPDIPRAKHDVRFNLPEINFSHDNGGWNWMGSGQDKATTANAAKMPIHRTMLHPSAIFANRTNSVATHVLDSHLESANTILRLKKQARQERRALKESGDYLGVQGINPATGQLDIETPTDSEESRPSCDTPKAKHKLPEQFDMQLDQDVSVDDLAGKEEKKRQLQARLDELCRMEKGKQDAQDLNGQVVWRRYTKEWSIVWNSSQNNNWPLVQGGSHPKSSTRPKIDQTNVKKPNPPLIDLESSQASRISDENRDSDNVCHYNDMSDGTVVRTPHQRSPADVSRSALELFQNGISFNHSGSSSKVGLGALSKHISSPAVSPTSRDAQEPNLETWFEGSNPLFNSGSYLAGNKRADRKLDRFLDQSRTQPPELGGEERSVRLSKMSRRALQRLTKPLRTQSSLGNITMVNTQTQNQYVSQKQKFKRGMSMPVIPLSKVDAWIVDIAHPTQDGDSPGRIQGKPLEDAATPSSENQIVKMMVDVSSRAARETRTNDLDLLQRQVQMVDAMRNHGKQQRDCGQRATTIVDITGKCGRIGESVCTPITTTTGYSQNGELSPGLVGCIDVAATPQEESTTCYHETTLNALPKTKDVPAATQNATLSATPSKCNQDLSVRYLKLTDGGTRTRIRTTMVQEKKSHFTEPMPSTSQTQEPNDRKTPKVNLKIAYVEERKRGQQSLPLVSMVSMSQKAVCGICSECLQVPGCFPVHLAADGAIAHHSGARVTDGLQTKQFATTMGTLCDNTVGQLIAALELYCKVVWPVFDPYSALWERNAKTETTLLDMVVVILALPGAVAVVAIALWGIDVVTAVGARLFDSVGRVK